MGNVITPQDLVDAGGIVGVRREKGVGMEIVTRRLRVSETEDQTMSRPGPVRHPKARSVSAGVTQDTRR